MKSEHFLNLPGLKNLARVLAKNHEHKDVIIGLAGPLGAGKTTFAQEFAKYFKVKKIKSPTFIIGTRYKIKNRYLYHYDFYRLNHARQLVPLDFEEILNSRDRIVLIEWVDKFPEIAKMCDYILTFEITGKNSRQVYVKTPKSQ